MTDRTGTRSHRASGTPASGATVTRYDSERRGLAAGVERGRSALDRLADRARRVWHAVDGTVSPAGWLLLGTALAGVGAALAWHWSEGAIVAAGAAMLLLVCVPFLLGTHTYEVELDLERDRVVAGTDLSATLEIANRGRRSSLPAVLDIPVGDGLVETQVPFLRPHATHRETLTIGASRRGVISVGPMTIGRGDPLGVLRRDHTWPGEQTIYVHPVTTSIPSTSAGLIRDLEGQVTRTIVDSDLSFHAIREYLPGDSRRHVNWKSTARTGRLMVRQYEETRRSRVAVVLDLAAGAYASDDDFEMAVSVAASLGSQAVRDGREVVVSTSGEIADQDRGRLHALTTLPTTSSRALLDSMCALESGSHVMPLDQVATMTLQAAPELSLVFLATGTKHPWADLRRAALSFPADVQVVVVRCETGAEPSLRTARDMRIATVGMLHDLGHLLLRASV
ncbi:DUF58 domain-containing protein [Demequina sp. NBRC 110054]|uniref:DUF58 domain-containing protein n=1 Tax=Demequina sp. NBRC 110054 TaxID=1570343 RepID=UPI0011777459|nr:DUF58 domain-containing protein [Demequina sp. NBRC 110054]